MPVYKDTDRSSWYVQFNLTINQGAHKSIKKRGFKTKHEAATYENHLMNLYQNIGNLTLQEFTEIYFGDKALVHRPTTLLVQQVSVNKHILPVLGNKKMAEITSQDIRNWQNQLIAQGNLKASSIKSITIMLTAIFSHAVNVYNLENNPTEGMHYPSKKIPNNFKVWSIGDFQKVLSIVSDDEITSLALKILFFEGIRYGELLALTPGDIHPDSQSISISKSYSEKLKIVQKTKNESSQRELLVPPSLFQELLSFVKKQKLKKMDRIFNGLYRIKLREAMKQAATWWHIPDIRIHDIRHSNATLINHMGFSPFIIKSRLGHASITTTLDVYTSIWDSDESDFVHKLDLLESSTNYNYHYPVVVDKSKEGYIASIPNFRQLTPFSAKTLDEIKQIASKLIQKELATQKEMSFSVPKPIQLEQISMDKNRIILSVK